MTLRLILMRHARATPVASFQRDFDRALDRQGVADCALIGGWLAERDLRPDAAIVSCATRTRETWAEVAKAWVAPVPVQAEDRLYEADVATMIDVLRRATGRIVAMVGHNPTVAAGAQVLVRDAPRRDAFPCYPPLATLVVEFAGKDWSDVRQGTGRVIAFTVPGDLQPAG